MSLEQSNLSRVTRSDGEATTLFRRASAPVEPTLFTNVHRTRAAFVHRVFVTQASKQNGKTAPLCLSYVHVQDSLDCAIHLVDFMEGFHHSLGNCITDRASSDERYLGFFKRVRPRLPARVALDVYVTRQP